MSRIQGIERHGWTVEAVYLGNPMRHDEKYLLINQGFAGKQRLMPFFNRQNNDDLILAIQAAGVSRGRNGFRKDKGGEKLAESEVIGLPLSQYAEKEHSSNTAPTAPTRFLPCGRSYRRSIRSTSVAKNSHTTILFCSRCPAYSDRQSRKRKVNLFLSL